MKKSVLLLVVAVFTFTQLIAQESTFAKGDKVLNLGIGFGSGYYTGLYYKTTVPPISASFEVGVKDGILEKGSIGIGGYIGYSAHKWDFSNTYYAKVSDLYIGARGSFHYPLVNKLDTYTGLLLGYRVNSYNETGTGTNFDASSSGVVYSWYIGGRYYFSDKFAAMAELGIGITYLNLGIALKF
jgi:hypothetical protein